MMRSPPRLPLPLRASGKRSFRSPRPASGPPLPAASSADAAAPGTPLRPNTRPGGAQMTVVQRKRLSQSDYTQVAVDRNLRSAAYAGNFPAYATLPRLISHSNATLPRKAANTRIRQKQRPPIQRIGGLISILRLNAYPISGTFGRWVMASCTSASGYS
jgi:hypothetical protein